MTAHSPRGVAPSYAGSMVERLQTMAKTEVRKVLRRVGFPTQKVEELLAPLDDPIDFDRDRVLLEEHGVTREHLTEMMGGSP
jgi:hypothetical protein